MKNRFLHFGLVASFFFAFMVMGSPIKGQTCPDAMTSYWKMGESSGPYMDSYGTHDAVAPATAPSMVSGASGKGQSFNPSSETYLSVEDHSSFDWSTVSSFTVEFWVKFVGTTGNVQVFVSRDDRPYSAMTWWIGAQTTGQISWFMQGSTGAKGIITTSATYNDNVWHHVVAVRDGVNGQNLLYVDGALQSPVLPITALGSLASSNPMVFGTYLYSGATQFHAQADLDEIAVYQRKLEPGEVMSHYSNIFQYQIGYCDGDNPKFISEPVTKATVNQDYFYDVDASGNTAPTYELITGPSGMTINSSTGMITWRPATQSINGHVLVRATNDKGSVDQEFNIFIGGAPECRANMLAYWNFNLSGASGLVDDISGYELTGDGPSTTNGIAGSGRSFDGVNDSLNLEDINEPSSTIFFDWADISSFSIEVWMRSDASPSNVMVLVGRDQKSNKSHWWLGVQPDGSVRFYLRDYPSNTTNIADISGGQVLDGDWHHIVGTYNSLTNDVNIYVDKFSVASTNQNFLNFGGDVQMNIGHLNTTGSQYWYDGDIDELAFYSTALYQPQISNYYDNAYAGNGACTFNYAPLIISTPDPTVMQDSPYSYEVVATDVNDGDVLSISVVSAPAWLDGFVYTPGDSTAVMSGTPGDADVGMNVAVVRVSDGKVSVDQQFNVEVLNLNDPPAFISVPVTTVDQSAEYSYTAQGEDPDGDDLSYSAIVLPSWMSFDPATQILSGIASNDNVGMNDVTLRVSDGVEHADQEFTVEVIDVNDAPVFTSSAITITNQNALYSYTVVAEDPDGDDISYVGVQVPAWLVFNANTRVLSGTPGNSEIGFHNVTIRVSDGTLEADQAFQIEVIDVDDPPMFVSTPITTVDQDAFYSYSVVATDDEGDPITYSAPILPAWLSFSAVTRILSGTPTNDDVDIHDIILRVSDGKNENDQVFQIVVNNVNDVPEITSVPETQAGIGRPYLYQVEAVDPDGDDLTFTAENLPGWLSLVSASNTAILSGTPQASDIGSLAIIIKVTDGIGDDIQAFSLTVLDKTGIEESFDFVNKVYPNPVSGKVYFELGITGEGMVKILDTKGSVIREVPVKNQTKIAVDISDFPAGIYYYSVSVDDNINHGKLFKR